MNMSIGFYYQNYPKEEFHKGSGINKPNEKTLTEYDNFQEIYTTRAGY